MKETKKTFDDIILDINTRAAIAFGLAMVVALLTYIAFSSKC